MEKIKSIYSIYHSMRAIYIVKGVEGGTYRGIGLLQDETKIIPYESTHHKLGHIEQAYDKTAMDIIPNFLDNCTEDITIYTNNTQLGSIITELDTEDITVNIEEDYYYNKYTHTKEWKSTNQLWKLALLFGFDERYMCNPKKSPEPPYEIYTDASLWDDYNKASVGFIILGDNGGMYSAGCPTPRYIQDNNIAECYAILSALKSLPNDARVTINTDSEYAFERINLNIESECSIIDNIKEELNRFKNNSVLNHVSRNNTFLPDFLADACKHNPWIIGDNPRIKL